MIANQRSDELLYLDSNTVRGLCAQLDPLEVIEEALRQHGCGTTVLPDEAYLTWNNAYSEAVRSINMPSYIGGALHVAGTKIINSNPRNIVRALPRASGLTLLFDPDTTRVQCVMDAAFISALRTASVSVLAMRILAPEPVRTLAVIGAGVIGSMHVEVASRALPALEQVCIFDLDSERARAQADRLRQSFGPKPELRVATSAESAMRRADATVAATTVTQSYIPFEWLRRGSVFMHVSLDDLQPEALLRADLLFVDDWNLVRADSRRILGRMFREGLIVGPRDPLPHGGARRVDAELADVVLGRHPGRSSPEDIIIVNPFGLAIEDVAIASRVFGLARAQNLGIKLTR